jgi:hypothetical protein
MSIQKVKIPYNSELAVKTLSVSDEVGFNGNVTLGGNIKLTGSLDTSSGSVSFTDGVQSKQGVPSITKINQRFNNYTLSASDERDTLIEMNLKTAGTLTIPADSPALSFPIGTTIDILQTNSGQITIVGGTGTIVNATPGFKIRSQWSIATILKRDANTWLVFGDLTT